MRKAVFVLFVGWFCCIADVPTHPQGRRVPPGVREADKQVNTPVEALAPVKRKSVDPARLREEAEELAKLSAAIPTQVDQVNKGQIPKDVGDQLKRIEKLAKHLRSESMP